MGKMRCLNALAYYHIKPKLHNEDFWQCNFNKKDIKYVCTASGFWLSVVDAWAQYNFYHPETLEKILTQPIWLNSHVRIINKTFFNKKMYDCGIFKISDLIGDRGTMSFEEITQQYINDIHFLEYWQVINAIPREWIRLINSQGPIYCDKDSNYEYLMNFEKISRIVYDKLIDAPDIAVSKWKAMQKILDNEYLWNDFLRDLVNVSKVTKITKYRNFQYKLLNNIIFLNDRLCKWGLVASDSCTFCGNAKENIAHLLWECTTAQYVWYQIGIFSKDEFGLELELDKDGVLRNKSNQYKSAVNLIVLVTKHMLYRFRCAKKKPNRN